MSDSSIMVQLQPQASFRAATAGVLISHPTTPSILHFQPVAVGLSGGLVLLLLCRHAEQPKYLEVALLNPDPCPLGGSSRMLVFRRCISSSCAGGAVTPHVL